MTFKQLQKKESKLHESIDAYFAEKYKKADTLERIKIRGVQRAIIELVEVNILLEAECNQ